MSATTRRTHSEIEKAQSTPSTSWCATDGWFQLPPADAIDPNGPSFDSQSSIPKLPSSIVAEYFENNSRLNCDIHVHECLNSSTVCSPFLRVIPLLFFRAKINCFLVAIKRLAFRVCEAYRA